MRLGTNCFVVTANVTQNGLENSIKKWQNIFYSFTVSQDNGVATSESINTQLNMVDQASGRAVATQNVSLYNLYKQRSYKCTVTALGNALIQPTMYFNVRHVPMFNGPYMITDVNHSIQPGSFQTVFNGVRQGIYDLPAIDSFLQSINQNLLTKLEELKKINKEQVAVSGITNTIKAKELPQQANNTLDTTNSCSAKVILPEYTNANPAYTAVNGTSTKVTPQELANALKRLIPSNPDLQSIIYCISYMKTYQKDSNTSVGTFNAWNNNLAILDLEMSYGGQISQLQRTYSCINITSNPSTSSSKPVAHFASLDAYINFMSGRLTANVNRILDIGLAKYYVCFWPKSNITPEYYDSHIGEFKQTKDTFYKALKSATEVGLTNADKTFKEQVCRPAQMILEKKLNKIFEEKTDALTLKFNELTLTDEDTQSKIDERYFLKLPHSFERICFKCGKDFS